VGDSSPGQHPARNADTQGFLYRLSTRGLGQLAPASRRAGEEVKPSPPRVELTLLSVRRRSIVKSVRRRRCERTAGESRSAADEVEAVDLCRSK